MSTEHKSQVHKKLNKAREIFHAKKHQKTGKNEFAKYLYFESEDFMPDTLAAYNEAGICGVVSYGIELATHTTTDVDDPSGREILITCPMSMATVALRAVILCKIWVRL